MSAFAPLSDRPHGAGAARRTVNSFDVARLAGVSQSAVSRSFTAGASVSAETRRKVIEAARRLGYQPHLRTRSPSSGRSRIVGLVLPEMQSGFHASAVQALVERLQRDGLRVLLLLGAGRTAEDIVGELIDHDAGALVLGATTLASPLAQRCADAGVPVVLFNRVTAYAAAGCVHAVRGDNEGGAAELARFLVRGGHRRIAFLAGREDSSTNEERERGFRAGLAEFGLRLWARACGDYDFEQARIATRELFGGPGPRPDAVFVNGDHMAIAALDTLRHELGLSVPQQVSVVGFDNAPPAAWSSYALTTWEQPVGAMVDAVASLLAAALRDPHGGAREIVVPGRLVLRRSARLPQD